MPVYRIPRDLLFPDPAEAEPSGLIGVGGDLEPKRLILGYQCGLFPWYAEGQPILWWSPDPRMVLQTAEFHVPRSLAKVVRRGDYRITLDTSFDRVLRACAATPRPGQDGTWLTREMEAAYLQMHELGYAHSCEAWRGDELVGGLYGVSIGGFFSGESMFAHAPDASKVAFVHLIEQLSRWGYPLIDCQVHTAHLERFGAREIPRADYLDALPALFDRPHRPGPWSFDPGFVCDGRVRSSAVGLDQK
jgi:leucyl/phenylalanyl-tRNA--protein transferase